MLAVSESSSQVSEDTLAAAGAPAPAGTLAAGGDKGVGFDWRWNMQTNIRVFLQQISKIWDVVGSFL